MTDSINHTDAQDFQDFDQTSSKVLADLDSKINILEKWIVSLQIQMDMPFIEKNMYGEQWLPEFNFNIRQIGIVNAMLWILRKSLREYNLSIETFVSEDMRWLLLKNLNIKINQYVGHINFEYLFENLAVEF